MCYDSILGILTACCVADSKNWTASNVVMILQTVQSGGAECWETLLGLTDCNMVGREWKEECLLHCVKLVKCVLEYLTVMVRIAIAMIF